MSKLVHDILLQAIEVTRPLAERFQPQDRDLASQLRRAASSAALNAAEGEWARKGHRAEHLSVAMNSAREAKQALRIAVAWGYITAMESASADDRFDHAAASLWRMIHG